MNGVVKGTTISKAFAGEAEAVGVATKAAATAFVDALASLGARPMVKFVLVPVEGSVTKFVTPSSVGGAFDATATPFVCGKTVVDEVNGEPPPTGAGLTTFSAPVKTTVSFWPMLLVKSVFKLSGLVVVVERLI